MKKRTTFLASLVLTFCLLLGTLSTSKGKSFLVSEVLLCTSKNSTVYHAYTCHGLKRCKSGIVRLSISEAVEYGRRACRICYR